MGGQHHALTALPPGKRPGTHRTGGWVGLSAGLDGCGKFRLLRPHRNLYPGPPGPRGESLYRLSYRSPVTAMYVLLDAGRDVTVDNR